MMQDVDRVLAEVASHAKTAGLDLESVREVARRPDAGQSAPADRLSRQAGD